MFVVMRPRSDGDGHVRRDVFQWRCAYCTKTFHSLAEIFLAYAPPNVGQQAVISWCHRRCGEAAPLAKGAKRQLWRGDEALRALLKTLVEPPISPALRKDLRGARRPWCDP